MNNTELTTTYKPVVKHKYFTFQAVTLDRQNSLFRVLVENSYFTFQTVTLDMPNSLFRVLVKHNKLYSNIFRKFNNSNPSVKL